jgi:DNA-binding transcriptional MerR regulator
MYFDSKTAILVTGVSRSQLQYWDEQGIIKPSVPASGKGTRRLYTFGDLVQLKTAKSLKHGGLSLQKLRKALVYLRRDFPDVEKPLAELKFITDGETVFALTDDQQVILDLLNRQNVWSFLFSEMVKELKGDIEKLAAKKKLSVNVRGKKYEVELTPDLEDGGYTIRCPELRANSQGRNEQEAVDNIIDAIELALDVMGELEQERNKRVAG